MSPVVLATEAASAPSRDAASAPSRDADTEGPCHGRAGATEATPSFDDPPSRPWLPLVRAVVTVAVLAVVGAYLVVPELRKAHWSELAQIDVTWLLVGGALGALSLFTYSLLTRSLLPREGPGLGKVFQIDSSCTALGHVVPAGSAASAALGYRLYTREGVKPADVCFLMASQGPGSSVVLNLMLWLALVVAIPFTGFDHVYFVAVLVGCVLMAVTVLAVFACTRGEERAVRVARRAVSRIPRVREDAAEALLRSLAHSLRELRRDGPRMRRALRWASINWVLDAASLWCFVAALGHYANPAVLFAAFGIANVAAALPITPSGLGVIEVVLPLLLAGSGTTASVATLAVVGWRLVNFWLPIPFGAGAYFSLELPRWRRSWGPRIAGRPSIVSRQ
ncbi:MAG: lysylphosphatidylglycerol synthase transmembrane domain-containing protein [Acidimicrobiales bacterium]